MQIPNNANAYVPFEKLVGYLLSETHAVGKSKARLFRESGFDETNIAQLERELRNIAQNENVEDIIHSPYGTKYVIDGSMKTPKGGVVRIRTGWIIETGRDNPRFVTAYPIV